MRKRKRGCLFPLLRTFLVLLLVSYGIMYAFSALFPLSYAAEIESAARENDLSPSLLYALVKAESNFDAKATSARGAKGLTQLMDDTAAWCSKKSGISLSDIYDPAQNIRIGAWYLRYLLDMYDGSETCAIAAYNAGHGRVDSWLESEKYSTDGATLSSIPYAETDKYVKKVIFYQKIYKLRLERE